MNTLELLFRKDLENQVVKYAVSRQIFCMVCSGILDQRTSTVITAKYGDEAVSCAVVCDKCLTANGGTREENLHEIGRQLKAAYTQKGMPISLVEFDHWK